MRSFRIVRCHLLRELACPFGRIFFSGLVCTSLLLGCGRTGPPRGEVQGTISIDGQPIENGSITLLPVDGMAGPTAGGVIENGSFRIVREKGPFPGRYQVVVQGWRKTGKMIDIPPDAANPEGETVEETVPILPKGKAVKPVEIEITDGRNQVDIDIPSQ